LKRKSRDIETYTEEELFLAVSTNGPELASGVGSSSSGSYSASLSSDISGDNIEEVLQNSETPFEGKKERLVRLHGATLALALTQPPSPTENVV